MIVKIAGVNRGADISDGTLRITDQINERSVCTFEMMNLSGLGAPEEGMEIIIEDDAGVRIFGGTIDEVEESDLIARTDLVYSVTCVDWHQIADRKIVAETYRNQTAGFIVNDLLTKYLADEGVTAGTIQTGPTVSAAVFNYDRASEALQDVAELTGFMFYIDANKVLHFLERTTNDAPWSITETSQPTRDLKVTHDRSQYRNRQYIRAGQDVTDPQTERQKGDGDKRVFNVFYPIAEVPTITVNTVPKTVGIGGLDSGKDFYWNKGKTEIKQDDAGTLLTSTDVFEIIYKGFFPIIVVSEDAAGIQDRKTKEGGTGVYEAVEQQASIDDADAALEYAKGRLRRYGKIDKRVTFTTFKSGLKAGQLLTIDLPSRGLTGQYLIQRVNIDNVSGNVIRYSVEAVDGEVVGGWVNFFRKLVKAGQTFVIRENEILVRLVTQFESWGWTENQTQTVYACPVPSATLYPSSTLYPC
jgi:hypothetical protein